MPQSRIFDQLDLPRYGRIAASMLGCSVPLAVCDSSGRPLWTSIDDAVGDELENMFRSALLEAWHGNNTPAGRARCYGLARGTGIVYRALDENSDGVTGWVALLLQKDNEKTAAFSSSAMAVLDEIVPLISGELGLVRELDDMAGELGDRYDELNLLCRTESVAKKTDCRDILSQHVHECASHLNVDLSVLWLQLRDTMFTAGALYRDDDDATNSWLNQFVDRAFHWFLNEQGRLGINLADDPSWLRLGVPGIRKVVAVPIRDSRGVICGVLACANGMDREDFSNSDRSLLEMVADKVTSCVRESQDELTGLLNRYGFNSFLEQTEEAVVTSGCGRVLCLMNIDQFKVINASYGHLAGDEALCETAALLATRVRDHGIAARFDADNFALLLNNMSLSDAEEFANSLCAEVGRLRLGWGDKCFSPSLSCGIVAVDGDISDEKITEIMQAAETALAGAKEAGSGQVEVYQSGNVRLVQRHQQLFWVERIKRALDDNRFVLYCQRIEPLSGKELHYEILVRMLDEDGGIVAPGMFIGTAERYNLMPAVDRWVISEAIKILSEQTRCGQDLPVSWGINLSGQSLNSSSLLEFISSHIERACLPARRIYLEITETSAVQNFHTCVKFMKSIQELGCRFALDDFGSGLSSFSYLKNLPVDYLKIDGSLVREMKTNTVDQAMVNAIAQVGRSMGLITIAEFVEDQETLHLLRNLGVDYAQGYTVMKPAPLVDELHRLMQLPEDASDKELAIPLEVSRN